MAHEESFWKLEHLSDAELLESLGGVLRTQRRSLAELVAHLGEVEERRLHLEAAHESMFAYCIRLGMSEDEACRRIELARLARKFPALFAELASGQISLSVALVLKPLLSPSNHLELLAAARGKCVRQARELVADRFPKPDVPSSIRKLPERLPVRASDRVEAASPAPSSAASAPLPAMAAATLSSPLSKSDLAAASPRMPPLPIPPLPEPPAPPAPTPTVLVPAVAEPPEGSEFSLSSPVAEGQERGAAPRASSAPVAHGVIEPLSAQRYRIQFTADARLKQQLELARNLLRHAHPGGDFGHILSRALELLIDDLMRRRFGARAPRKATGAAGEKPANMPSATSASAANVKPSGSQKAPNTPASEQPNPARSSTTVRFNAPSARCSHIPRATRRAVFERDGLGCSWADARGVRCGSRAWLEIDHRQPAGKGGSSEPDNLRLLCRAHNRLAAEQAYGREHIEQCARREEAARAPRPRA